MNTKAQNVTTAAVLRGLALIPTLFVLPLALFSLHEWWQVWWVAEPQTLARYQFGSPRMVLQGGWQFTSAATYAWSAFIQAWLWLLFVGVVWAGFWRKHKRIILGGYGILVLSLVLQTVLPSVLGLN